MGCCFTGSMSPHGVNVYRERTFVKKEPQPEPMDNVSTPTNNVFRPNFQPIYITRRGRDGKVKQFFFCPNSAL